MDRWYTKATHTNYAPTPFLEFWPYVGMSNQQDKILEARLVGEKWILASCLWRFRNKMKWIDFKAREG